MYIPLLKEPKEVNKTETFETLTEVAPQIYIIDNSLSEEFCKNLIARFDQDPRKVKGVSGNGYNEETKDTHDLHISSLSDYSAEDKVFHAALNKSVNDFKQMVECKDGVKFFNCPKSSFANDTGYQLQRYIPGGGYIWHHDGDGGSGIKKNIATGARSLVFMWYLNEVNWGGGTGFKHQDVIVEPKTGRLVLFPASWTHIHCAYPVVAGTKYISTGWIFEQT